MGKGRIGDLVPRRVTVERRSRGTGVYSEARERPGSAAVCSAIVPFAATRPEASGA